MKSCNRITAASLVLCIGLGCVGLSAVQAETIAYWRFEGDASTFASDSGPNSLGDLSVNTGGTAPVAVTLPSSGAGANFDNPVPLTKAANLQTANCGTATSDGHFYQAYQSEFHVTDFTLEAYVNRATDFTTRNQYIAGQWQDSSNGYRSWALGVARSSSPPSGTEYKELFILLSSDGSVASTVGSDLLMDAGVDYFVAVTYDSAADTITFYVRNQETGVLQTSTAAIPFGAGSSLYHSTGIFQVGSAVSADWTGLLDEVRYSNTALSEDQLLIAPEPASMATVVLGLGAILFRRRIRR